MFSSDLGNESYNFLTKTYIAIIFNYCARNDLGVIFNFFLRIIGGDWLTKT